MNLKGGYKILLLPIMSLVEVATAITDIKVLEQLSTLKTYMGKKELKPILLHCEIEKESTITKHCVMGELKKISDTEYVIIGKIDKAYLTISVEFTQDEETGEYYIASGDATYILSETTKIGDLIVDGGITSKGIANTGNIANTGDIATVGKITGGEIIENMSGYSLQSITIPTGFTIQLDYIGVCKNGNKLTFVISGTLTKGETASANNFDFAIVSIPKNIYDNLFNNSQGYLDQKPILLSENYYTYKTCNVIIGKVSNEGIRFRVYQLDTLTNNTPYTFRIEETFLLSENLVS